MFSTRRFTAAVVLCLALPSAVYAQAAIAGTIKDPSGAVLPGVTVEASSPALIEKTRSVVSDGTGQYKIQDLRPGSYSVTFTLGGFNAVKRESVELTGSFIALVNVEMKVGAVEESITVTGETPIVDVQSTAKERVLPRDVIEAIPTGRLINHLSILVPGVGSVGGSGQDVGGAAGDQMANLVVHGSRADSSRTTINGQQFEAISAYMGGRVPNIGAVQEMTIDTGGITGAELGQGGPRVNLIPRDGGNTFRGAAFGSFANHSMEGSNNTPDLISRGLPVPNSIDKNWDINGGFGGPVKKDTLWFYTTLRSFGTHTYVGAGNFINLNANNPNAWTYAPDLTQPAKQTGEWKDAQNRFTWQTTPRNKMAFTWDVQERCGLRTGSASVLVAWEAMSEQCFPQEQNLMWDWTAPVTSRLLLEAGLNYGLEGFHSGIHHDATNPSQMIGVVEQSTGFSYRAPATYSQSLNAVFYPRIAVSYVTGAHAFKVGYNDEIGYNRGSTWQVQSPVSYRFNNGVPNQLTEYATPYLGNQYNLQHDLGLYAQDKWSVRNFTLSYGVRYDHRQNSFPDQQLGAGVLVPTRNFSFAALPNESLHDISPRLGLVYDPFGQGKTALKVTLNRYVQGGPIGNSAGNLPASLVNSTTRTWTDANKNFVPDCALTNPLANGECAAMANSNFGKSISSVTVDPNVITGWGHRNYNWEFSTGIQQQVMPGVSVDIGYFRRWYGNFTVTDNLTVAASDYTQFSLTAPANALLPGGGGYTVSGLYDLNPAKFGLPANNLNTLSDNYGNQIEHWNGVDVGVNARVKGGVLLQGGLSTGRTVMDNCAVVAQVPEMLFGLTTLSASAIAGAWLPAQYCHQDSGFLTQAKFLGTYRIPKVDVQISGTLQSLPGPLILANYNAPNAVVAPSLGRSLAGGAANVTVDLLAPGSYGDRLNQLDLRFGKIIKAGRTRTSLSVDLYNALNRSPVTQEQTAYAAFRQPLQILLARFAKLTVNIDF